MATSVRSQAGFDPAVIDRRNMPYTLDEGLGSRARIGLLVLSSDYTIEHEFRLALALPGVAFYGARLYNAPTITPETLRAMEGEIAKAAALILPGDSLDVVAYGCTSGAMTMGAETVAARIHEARPEVAATDPMTAAFAAFRALGVRRICLIVPYLDEINQAMRHYVREHGFSVPVMGAWNEPDDRIVSRISPASVRDAVLELGRSDLVDAVFVSCTSIRVAEIAEDLERELGKPVTASNHALAWHCLRLAGVDDALEGLGSLFRLPLS
jgi:maleate isomerase